MSKRVEILSTRLNQLKSEKDKLDTRTHKLRMRKQNEQKLMLGSYFSVSNDKYACTATSDTRVSLHYKEDSYGSIVSYELRDNWSRDEMHDVVESSRVYHNGSTYENIDESILIQSQARFEFMQCAVDFNDDIIAAWNNIEKKYDKLTATFSDSIYKLSQAISSQSSDITKLEKEALREKLTGKGLKFRESAQGRLPQLEVRWDWNVSRIKALKVVRTTASGKSADLLITQESNRWDSATESYVNSPVTDTFTRVRMDKVEALVRSAERNSQLV